MMATYFAAFPGVLLHFVVHIMVLYDEMVAMG